MTDFPPVGAEYLKDWRGRAHGSPLYRRLAEVVADDPELIRVINRIEHRPSPNMLFASVQFLLMQGADSPLREYYPSLVDDPRPVDGVAGHFKEFVLDHEESIAEMGRARYTQTNECKRCAALLPAVWATGLERFHLIEIGASAGLNLAMDRYRYRWGDIEWGPDSPVLLEAGSRGGRVRPREIEILSRIGLDLNPIDMSDPEERAWLDALIWPEHQQRRRRLEEASSIISEVSLELVKGDATETLPEILGRLPVTEPVIVMNSMALMQFGRTQRETLYTSMAEEGERRTLSRVSFEVLAAGDEWVTLSVDRGAGLAQIGQAHPHGEWIELYARP